MNTATQVVPAKGISGLAHQIGAGFSWIGRGVERVMFFTARFFQRPQAVGSLVPSSSWLGAKMVRHVPVPSNAMSYYLEVGPGTGSLTDVLLKKLDESSGDAKKFKVDLVEADDGFCQVLKEKYGDRTDVEIHCLPIQEWKPGYKYEAAVTSIPLNSLPAESVDGILKAYEDLLKEGASLSWVEYALLPTLKRLYSSSARKLELDKVQAVKDKFLARHGCGQDLAWFNIPPARVYHSRMAVSKAQA